MVVQVPPPLLLEMSNSALLPGGRVLALPKPLKLSVVVKVAVAAAVPVEVTTCDVVTVALLEPSLELRAWMLAGQFVPSTVAQPTVQDEPLPSTN